MTTFGKFLQPELKMEKASPKMLFAMLWKEVHACISLKYDAETMRLNIKSSGRSEYEYSICVNVVLYVQRLLKHERSKLAGVKRNFW